MTIRKSLRFFFPPVCIGCSGLMEEGYEILCQQCMEALHPIDPSTACQHCGTILDGEKHHCMRGELDGCAVCFEESLPGRVLLTMSGEHIAPFIIMQWHERNWPLPDLVMPTPGDWFSRGQDRWGLRKELAKTVAKTLGQPYLSALTVKRHAMTEPYHSLENHPHIKTEGFVALKSPERIVNTTVLLIHDEKITGKALDRSAQALKEGGARAIYGISLL